MLTVQSPVRGARVLVDGTVAGTVPTESIVRAGRHTVVVRRQGFQEGEEQLVVTNRSIRSITVPLADIPPVTARWWFWTGVGVAVAGGVTLTVALLTERSPDEGTIPPESSRPHCGTACAPRSLRVLMEHLRTAPARSALALEPGTVLAGKYRVERVLGTGGMGIVVAARHLQLDQMVALKFLRKGAIDGSEAQTRFLREAKASVNQERARRECSTSARSTTARRTS